MAQKPSTFRLIRIITLLTILGIVAFNQWQTRSQTAKWDQSQWVVIYPVNSEGDNNTQEYIDSLNIRKFNEVETYLNREAHRYGVELATPFTVELAPTVVTLPPELPKNRTTLAVIWYSLKLRYYGLTTNSYEGPTPDIKIYVKYYKPEQNKTLNHSIGMEKGKIGIVNGFSTWKYAKLTNVIIAHEILHTVGATDKYDMTSNLPHYPSGYGDPEKQPLLPQTRAEIMGGPIVISKLSLQLPKGLWETTIGARTAREINWLKEER